MFQPRHTSHTLPTAVVALALLLAVAGCTREVPELDQTRTEALRDAPYPALIPLESALATGAATPDSAQQLEREMTRRRALLKARADRLRAAQSD
ncbi:MAG: hypothetical protein QNK42_08250 [Pseudodonghicola sp.]|nr:hypothetical protein [Pseudodonghicola sp.]